ncbi:hypothetical protein AB0G73_34675 [Streptomyces sp. NPDC020719]|uniref:hypothetical protein n=1 Tax=Streptomyces sp. NPDC020719 TaxID=3154896 RepID=UPI003407F628
MTIIALGENVAGVAVPPHSKPYSTLLGQLVLGFQNAAHAVSGGRSISSMPCPTGNPYRSPREGAVRDHTTKTANRQ